MTEIDQDVELLNNIRTRMPELKRLLNVRHSYCHYVDQMFHFYHRSWRVYYLQDETRQIVEVLGSLGPKGTKFCQEFEVIIQQGINVKKLDFEQVIQQVLDGRDAERAYNKQWTSIRPAHRRSLPTCQILSGNDGLFRQATGRSAGTGAPRAGSLALLI